MWPDARMKGMGFDVVYAMLQRVVVRYERGLGVEDLRDECVVGDQIGDDAGL
ncbi:MAG: hypothetical protein LKF41_00140 [Bifidobacterium sp.]|jgi:hypothetical protein|nr:hypothetical protein [Bifidobacterium sp.]MCH4174255.1 hypothetical protein [Bifidobacterium sp.]